MANPIENYYAVKRAFKKRLGLFDKDVAIEELAAQQTEDDWLELEAEQILMERDEQHHIKSGFHKNRWEEDYAWKEKLRQLEERGQVEKRWEDFSITEIEKEYKQNLEEQNSNELMPFHQAAKIISTLVDERNNKIITRAWERILRG